MQDQTTPQPYVLTGSFSSSGHDGFSLDDYEPGRIVPCPTEKELALFRDGKAEPLAAWWGGEWEADPPRVEGKLFPALLQRPATGALYVRTEVNMVRRLKDCERPTALQAVRRCADPYTLAVVKDETQDSAVRHAAQLRLQGELALDSAVCILGRANPPETWVVLAGGEELPTGTFYAATLKPLVEKIEDVNLLDLLDTADGREPVKKLTAARREALANPAAQAEDGAGEQGIFDTGQAQEDTEAAPGPFMFSTDGTLLLFDDKGNGFKTADLTVETLKAALADCTEKAVLDALLADPRVTLQHAVSARIAELAEAAQ